MISSLHTDRGTIAAQAAQISDEELAAVLAERLARRCGFHVETSAGHLRFKAGAQRWFGWRTMGAIQSGDLVVETHGGARHVSYEILYSELLLVAGILATAVGVVLAVFTQTYLLAVLVSAAVFSFFFFPSVLLARWRFRRLLRQTVFALPQDRER